VIEEKTKQFFFFGKISLNGQNIMGLLMNRHESLRGKFMAYIEPQDYDHF